MIDLEEIKKIMDWEDVHRSPAKECMEILYNEIKRLQAREDYLIAANDQLIVTLLDICAEVEDLRLEIYQLKTHINRLGGGVPESE